MWPVPKRDLSAPERTCSTSERRTHLRIAIDQRVRFPAEFFAAYALPVRPRRRLRRAVLSRQASGPGLPGSMHHRHDRSKRFWEHSSHQLDLSRWLFPTIHRPNTVQLKTNPFRPPPLAITSRHSATAILSRPRQGIAQSLRLVAQAQKTWTESFSHRASQSHKRAA